MITGQAGTFLSAHGPAAVRMDGNVPVRLSRRARHAARPSADAALRLARRYPAPRRLAGAAQSAASTNGAREVRRVPREDQHGSVGCPHRHRSRGLSLWNLVKYISKPSFNLDSFTLEAVHFCI